LAKKKWRIAGLRSLHRATTRGATAFEKAVQNNRA
jgi:hypothetical protein